MNKEIFKTIKSLLIILVMLFGLNKIAVPTYAIENDDTLQETPFVMSDEQKALEEKSKEEESTVNSTPTKDLEEQTKEVETSSNESKEENIKQEDKNTSSKEEIVQEDVKQEDKDSKEDNSILCLLIKFSISG